MRYIREFKDIDWNDWDEEEIDPTLPFDVGDKVILKTSSDYTIFDDIKNTPRSRKFNKSYIMYAQRVASLKTINNMNYFKIEMKWPYYLVDEWTKK